MTPCGFSVSSNNYADFIFRYSARSMESVRQLIQTQCINFVDRDFAIIHVSRDVIPGMSVDGYGYSTIPKLFALQDTSALEAGQIPLVFDQPALLATGRGVMIGFIDTGIDYANPLFRNRDGTSRIAAIWDQTIDSETVPDAIAGFQPFYGTVYSREQINEALSSEDPLAIVPSRDTDGHGTFMAGVAAANRVESPVSFSGAAPEATLAVVKLKPAKPYLRDFFLIRDGVPAFQENDVMTALSFLLATAGTLRMPLVVYVGVGTSQGDHDGTLPLGRQILNLTGAPGLAVVAGAGNEVGYHHHFFGNMASGQTFEDVELRVGQDEPGFCLELWARQPELFTVGFVSPSGEVIDRIPLSLGPETTVRFRLDASVITLSYQNYETASGSQLIFMRFQSPAPGIWHVRVFPSIFISGQFHMWLPMHGFLSDDTIFLRPHPDTTITDPGNSPTVITAATYDHRNESIAIHSSRGYTRSGLIKPDFAAPGAEVQGPALPSSDAGEIRFTRRTGSSVAAAIAAGAVADIFTWGIVDGNDRVLNGASVNSMLIRGAGRNPSFSYPNREWGFGTLDLYQAFLTSRE